MHKYSSSFITLFFFIISITSVFAQIPSQKPLQTITLTDGSSIQGHLVGITGDEYTIENETMGQVKVPASKVAGINIAGTTFPNPSVGAQVSQPIMPSAPNMQLNATHLSIMQDPQIMALLQEMMADPQVSQLLVDPSLLQAAMSMDPEKIKDNPQVQVLIQHPKMQEILKLTAQKLQNSAQLPPQP